MGGKDKGLMALNGRPLVEYLLRGLKPQTGRIANRHLDRYREYGVPVVKDQTDDYPGPLAGFAAAMQQAETDWIITVPCDVPLMVPDMAQRLINALKAEDADLAVAHDGERLQPVHALIPVRLLADLQAFMAAGGRTIHRWYARHQTAVANSADVAAMFHNINTPEQKRAMENRNQ